MQMIKKIKKGMFAANQRDKVIGKFEQTQQDQKGEKVKASNQ